MKNKVESRGMSNPLYKFTERKFRKSIWFSLKTGIITFILLFILLIGFDNLTNAVNGNNFVIDKVNILISVLGFLLIFSAKFLENFFGKG